MKHYLVCDAQGFILRKGLCKDQDFTAQAKPGEFVFEGFGSETRDKVDLATGKILKDVIPLPTLPAVVPLVATVHEKVDTILDYLATDTNARKFPKLKALLEKLGK